MLTNVLDTLTTDGGLTPTRKAVLLCELDRLKPVETTVLWGDTFVLTADFSDAQGAPQDLSAATIACQLRDAQSNLVAALTVTPDPTVVGRLVLTFPGDTSAWPTGTLRSDIEITAASSISSTQTFTITVVDRITQ